MLMFSRSFTNDKKGSAETLYELEEKTAGMLEDLEGISDVKIMISVRDRSENTSSFSSRNVDTSDISSLYADIDGVAVTCKGGNSKTNQARIISLISALFGVPTNRIFVGE